MAIAYFIPDQRKLLAAHGNAAQQQTTSSNEHGNTGNDRHGDDDPSGGNNSATTTSIYEQRPHNFRANITIPLPAYRSNRETATCWDLITQVFCSTLRFYHEAQLSPSVIEIAFEFSDGFADTTLSAASATTATTRPPTASSTTMPTTTTTTIPTPPRAVSSRRTTNANTRENSRPIEEVPAHGRLSRNRRRQSETVHESEEGARK